MSFVLLKNNGLRLLWASVFLLAVCAGSALADEGAAPRRVEETKRLILDEAPSRELIRSSGYSFSSGGWVNFRYTGYRDTDNDNLLEDAVKYSLRHDVRLWGKLTRQDPAAGNGASEYIYIRLKNIYTQNAGIDAGERYDNRGPQVDYAYAGFDHAPWKIEAGRKYFNIGRGIAYSGVHDGVQVNYREPGWNVAAFVSRLPPHTDNMDTSIPGYDKESRRVFAGAGLGFAGIEGHQLYGYAVAENDRSREEPEDPLQDYDYNARYFGIGSKGEWAKGWPYWVEMIRVTGHAREDISNAQSDIAAWAFDVEQQFVTDHPSGLTFSLEAAAGSGDSDRLEVTNTINGNGGGKDRGFIYFGYLPTGVALSPALSNLRMLRAGAAWFPCRGVPAFKSLSVGVDVFGYWKDRPFGAVDDAEAQNDAREIGREVDVRLDWRVSERLLVSAEWGVFMPGKAYDLSADDNTRVGAVSVSVFF